MTLLVSVLFHEHLKPLKLVWLTGLKTLFCCHQRSSFVTCFTLENSSKNGARFKVTMKRCHWIPWHTSITSAQCIHRTSAASCMFLMRFSTLSIYLLLLCLTLCIIAVKPLMWILNCMLILTIIFCSIVSRLLSFFMQHFFNWIWLLAFIGTVLEMACKGKLGKHTVCGVAFRWYPAVWKRVCSLLFGVKWLVPEKCKCKINLKWGVTGQMKTSGSVKWHNDIVTQLKMLMPIKTAVWQAHCRPKRRTWKASIKKLF